MNQHIFVSLVQAEKGFAYDIEIKDEKATLWQYITALDAFLDEKVAPCLGCDTCCYQRIPLTLPDIYSYCGDDSKEVAAFLSQRTVIQKEGKALDIFLRRREDESCTYLDIEEQRCLNHPKRSLVCHTYICLPQTQRAREMREFLINEGEDALFGALFQWGLLGENTALKENYPIKPTWQGKTYDEILLKDVLSTRLWEILTKPLS